MRRFTRWSVGFSVVAFLLVDRLALADLTTLRERVTTEPQEFTAVPSGGGSPLWGIAISIVLALAVIAVSIMPSKRGHQD